MHKSVVYGLTSLLIFPGAIHAKPISVRIPTSISRIRSASTVPVRPVGVGFAPVIANVPPNAVQAGIPICGPSIYDHSSPTCQSHGGDAYATQYVKDCMDYLSNPYSRKPSECSWDDFNDYKSGLIDCAQKSSYQCEVGGGVSAVIGVFGPQYAPGTHLNEINAANLNFCIFNKYSALCRPNARGNNCPNRKQDCWNAIGEMCKPLGAAAPVCNAPPPMPAPGNLGR